MDLSMLLAFVPTQYAVYVMAGLGACAAVTANIPAPSNPTLASAWRVLNVLGQNYRHAANAPATTLATSGS